MEEAVLCFCLVCAPWLWWQGWWVFSFKLFCLRCEGTLLVGPTCELICACVSPDGGEERLWWPLTAQTLDDRHTEATVFVVSVKMCGPGVCGSCGVCQ
jgi:hypothetical protein